MSSLEQYGSSEYVGNHLQYVQLQTPFANHGAGYISFLAPFHHTCDQKNIIELKELKIEKLILFIESIEEKNTDKTRIKNKVEELNDIIDDLRLEILSIKENPEGDYPDHLIEQSIEDRMDEIKSNPLDYAEDWGLNIKDYVDMESLAEYIVETDGYGVGLARYDGEENEEYILGKLYYIFRID